MSALATSYVEARVHNRANGVAHRWGVLALPRGPRNDVRAVYAFARRVVELVDGPSLGESHRRRALDDVTRRLSVALLEGRSDDLDLAAVVDTATRWDIPGDCFDRYLRAMDRDLRRGGFDDERDLLEYVDGAACAPADMVLPILEPEDLEAARPPAHHLAVALHLADLLADVGTDLDRGRCYLPRQEVERHGAGDALTRRYVTPGWIALARSIVDRARAHLAASAAGLALLPPPSRRYVSCARRYARARLDALEAAGFDVFGPAADVPLRSKVAVVSALVRPGRAWR